MNDAHDRQFLEHFILTRAIEEKMLIYLRQGKISKWFASYGQEALSVAATHALAKDEFMCTMHPEHKFTCHLQSLFESQLASPFAL